MRSTERTWPASRVWERSAYLRRLTRTAENIPSDMIIKAMEHKTRLKLCAAQINQKYDVDGLCRALPKRLKMLEERKGDRISK